MSEELFESEEERVKYFFSTRKPMGVIAKVLLMMARAEWINEKVFQRELSEKAPESFIEFWEMDVDYYEEDVLPALRKMIKHLEKRISQKKDLLKEGSVGLDPKLLNQIRRMMEDWENDND